MKSKMCLCIIRRSLLQASRIRLRSLSGEMDIDDDRNAIALHNKNVHYYKKKIQQKLQIHKKRRRACISCVELMSTEIPCFSTLFSLTENDKRNPVLIRLCTCFSSVANVE